MYMIMLVLDDPNKLDDVLDAWDAVGVGGATMYESSGIHRRRIQRGRIPFRFNFGQLGAGIQEVNNYTLFTVVDSEDMVHECVTAVEEVVGDLSQPRTGVLAAWPLMVTKGVPKKDIPPKETA